MPRSIQVVILIFFVFAASYQFGCYSEDARKDQRRAQLDEIRRQNTAEEPAAQNAAARIPAIGRIEPVAEFYGPMPTGVAVSKTGRIFVNFPRWGDPVQFTVAEIVDGKPVAYPNAEMQQLEKQSQNDTLISVQSVVVDAQNRLWILDTGSVKRQEVKPGGPKLICVDLNTNQIIKKIMFPDSVALPTSYLNDVRFDLSRGEEGTAFITDSSEKGPNGLIVVDLKSRKSWRKLSGHIATTADDSFVPVVEGQPLVVSEPGKPEEYLKIGSDGIAIDNTRDLLYLTPLASRRLYRIKLDALMSEATDDQTEAALEQMPSRDFASDGLECDQGGSLYLTDYEHNAIRRLSADGQRYETVASDPRMIWPDSMAISKGGYLYFTANQLNRQARFHMGQDLREKPYWLFRTYIGGSSPTAAAGAP